VQRARSVEHRQARLTAILDAVAAEFDVRGPDLTLGQIAEATGLTRTTLYGYAATREELLLLLTERELTRWFAQVQLRLSHLRSASAVSRAIVDELLVFPRLPSLLALCSVLVERNVSLEAATRWKAHLQHQVVECGESIDRICEVDAGAGTRFLLHTYASLIGLHSLAFPPEVAAKAISGSNAQALVVDFERELRFSISTLASTLLA
jgi:AcrR family transcriptional regulator